MSDYIPVCGGSSIDFPFLRLFVTLGCGFNRGRRFLYSSSEELSVPCSLSRLRVLVDTFV